MYFTYVLTASGKMFAHFGGKMLKFIEETAKKVLSGQGISCDEAVKLANMDDRYLYHLIAWANDIRERYRGKTISLCGIINAKSGKCHEDCAFCAQSIYHKTKIKVYPLMTVDEIIAQAKELSKIGAKRISIVTSGRRLDKYELKTVYEAVEGMKELGIKPCASLGLLNEDELKLLKSSGLVRFHHNLQSSPDFYPRICTTHDFESKIKTIKAAKSVGLEVCCGGIVGMGETMEQRIELLFLLQKLNVDAVPINFLHPIPGTRLENARFLNPILCLKIIAVSRFVLPNMEIIIAGGRELNLKELQNFMFAAGASGTIIGNYLTTKGRNAEDDKELIADMNLNC